MMPMTQTGMSSSFNLNYNNGSLKVRHINEVDKHIAVAIIFYIKIKINKKSSSKKKLSSKIYLQINTKH